MVSKFPLSLYIHLPWCEKKCPYCDFNVTTNIPNNFSNFSKALISDIEASSEWIQNRKFSSIYFGGGTPSLADPSLHESIIKWLTKNHLAQSDIEITLECNPKETNLQNLNRFMDIGINRFSLGIQSFDEGVLKDLGRNHTYKESYKAIEELEKISSRKTIDLMYGCPNQTLEKAAKDIEVFSKSNIKHLSYYQLTLEPNTVFYSRSPKLPSEDEIEAIESACKGILNNKLFSQYEVSSWSRENDLSTHNLNYWNYGDYLGIGPGSHSKISIEEKSIRFTKLKKVSSYIEDQAPKLMQSIEGKELDMDIAMNFFRLKNGPDVEKIETYLQLSNEFLNKCKDAQKEGLLLKDKLVPTQKGFNYLNELIALF